MLDGVAPDEVVARRPAGHFTPDQAVRRRITERIALAEQVQHARLGDVRAGRRPEVQDAEQLDAAAIVDAVDQRAVVAERRTARPPSSESTVVSTR